MMKRHFYAKKNPDNVLKYIVQSLDVSGWPQILWNKIPWNFPDFSMIEMHFPWPNKHKISELYYRNVGLVKGRIPFSMFCIIFAD